MKAYKFLRDGRVGPFSGFAWPETGWVGADGPLDSCRSGIHACLAAHLAYWITDELWAVELEGDIVETPCKVVARRGRLTARVDGWDAASARAFAHEGVRRTARYAALELREAGMETEATLLEQAASTGELAAAAAAVSDLAAEARLADASELAALVVDAAAYADAGHTTGPAFIAAHAADIHAPVGVDDPFVAERADQGQWLARLLGISDQPS